MRLKSSAHHPPREKGKDGNNTSVRIVVFYFIFCICRKVSESAGSRQSVSQSLVCCDTWAWKEQLVPEAKGLCTLSPHVRWRRPKTSQLFKISCHLYSQLIYLGGQHLFGAPATSRRRVTLELKRTFLKNTCSHNVRGRKRSNPGSELQLPVHQNLGIWFGRSLFQNFHVGHTAEIRVRDSKDLSQRSGLKAIQLSGNALFSQAVCRQYSSWEPMHASNVRILRRAAIV